jgi:hypothetical protein
MPIVYSYLADNSDGRDAEIVRAYREETTTGAAGLRTDLLPTVMPTTAREDNVSDFDIPKALVFTAKKVA